jgi:hypothetical protein
MSAQWYLSSEGQTLGPYSGEQLQQFASEGRIIASTLLWAEGMAEWLPAEQIPGVLPQPAEPAPAAAAATAAPAWAPPGARAGGSAGMPASTLTKPGFANKPGFGGAAPADAPYPHIPVKPASFGLWAGTFVGGFVLIIVALVAGIASAQQNPENPAAGFGLAGIMLVLGFISLFVSTICYYIVLYRAWLCLRAGAPRTTPGSAVGLLFVPFFNLYWMFIAIHGLPKDWNRICDTYEDLRTAPRLNETTFLLFCISSIVFAPLAIIINFPLISQLCKGINFFAYRKNLSAPTSGSSSALGGIKFG